MVSGSDDSVIYSAVNVARRTAASSVVSGSYVSDHQRGAPRPAGGPLRAVPRRSLPADQHR